ncbi:MAG: RAMP superfamily CRISPR-associated protein [Desulfatiglandales bacterium]
MHEYTFSIGFDSPFFVGAGYGRGGLFDQSTIFDGTGCAYIPGSALKGKLRHVCRRVIKTLAKQGVKEPMEFQTLCPSRDEPGYCRTPEPCAFCRLFGSPLHPGRFFFEDAYPSDSMDMYSRFGLDMERAFFREAQTEARTRVSLERTRRVARRGHLLSSETGAAFLEFKGKIQGPDPEDGEALQLLDFALRTLTHLGAGGGAGLGRIKGGLKRS